MRPDEALGVGQPQAGSGCVGPAHVLGAVEVSEELAAIVL